MTDTKSELKPCPFCGSDNLMYLPEKYNYSEMMVECADCGVSAGYGRGEEGARRIWNTRTPDLEEIREKAKEQLELGLELLHDARQNTTLLNNGKLTSVENAIAESIELLTLLSGKPND